MSPAAIPPVALVPALLDKPWGGDALARWGLPVAPGSRIGEAWLFADIGTTSAGGAGGGAYHSVVAGAARAGTTLRDLAHEWPGGLAGAGAEAEHPLLVKLLHAREHLSVQVHPSPAYAAAHPSARLKAESWYVLHAEPGAELFLGLAPGTTAADAVRLAREGRIAEALVRVPAVAGECHTLPSGLVHALGAGVVAVEVQTASDTTFRLYDWAAEYARPARELHLTQAEAAMLPAARPVTVAAAQHPEGRREVARTAQFTWAERHCPPGGRAPVRHGAILVAVSGHGTCDGVVVGPARAVFAPTGGEVTTPPDRSLTWLEATLA